MKPREKAAKGLKLIRESVLVCLEKHKNGLSNVEICKELGLQQEPDRFTRVLSWEMLQLLEHEGHIRSKGKRRNRVYFLV